MKALENQMKLYFRFFTLMGQFPFKLTEKGLEPSTRFKLCGIAPMAAIATTTVLRIKFELPYLDIREAALRSLGISLGICLTGATLIIPIFKSDLHRNVFQIFNRVQKYFRYLGIATKERENIYPPLLMLFKQLFILGGMIAAECAFPYWGFEIVPIHGLAFYWILTLIMTFVIVNCETYAHLLITRYNTINKELINIDQGIKSEVDEISDRHLIENLHETSEVKKIYSTHVSHFKNSNDIAASIRLLTKSHYELYGICSSLGSLFTFPIVLTVLLSGCEILVTCYHGLGDMLNDGTINSFKMLTWSKYVLFDFFRVICILRAFTAIEKAGNRTSYHVHGLIVKIDDSDVQKELTKFSQQLHHQKINFSNLGLFSLDMSLLASMTGAIITYLVILLQSQGKERNCPGY